MIGYHSFQIANVTHKDIKEVYELLVANRPYVGLNSLYTYFLLARDFSNTCLVAKSDSKIIAFSSGYVPPKRSDTFFNWEVVVSKKYRGYGLQKTLLLEQLSLTQAKFLELTVNPSNIACQQNIVMLATILNSPYHESVLFDDHDFETNCHEPEILFRIGPIDSHKIDFLKAKALLHDEIPVALRTSLL